MCRRSAHRWPERNMAAAMMTRGKPARSSSCRPRNTVHVASCEMACNRSAPPLCGTISRSRVD
jgi:hypothetical protein